MIDVLVVGGIFREVLDGDSKPAMRYGGSGLSASVAAGRLGASVALASYVGAEDEPAVRDELHLAGVDTTYILALPGASGTFVFPTNQDDAHPWPMYRPAEATPSTAPGALPVACVVLVFGIPDFDPVAAGWIGPLGAGTSLVWDRQGWLSRARDAGLLLRLDPIRNIYIANEREAADDAGLGDIEEAMTVQPPDGFEAAVIKRGTDGVVVFERVGRGVQKHRVPAYEVTGTSTIGTGDVFAGAFCARLARGDSPSEAARWGCAAAAIVVETGSSLLVEDAVERINDLFHRSRN